ncbi:hypothetical protein Tco_0767343 [Tanacetum coccineum]
MPPRRLKRKSVKRLVEKRVAKAIEEYEKSRANLDSARSSGGNTGNAGGTVNVQAPKRDAFVVGPAVCTLSSRSSSRRNPTRQCCYKSCLIGFCYFSWFNVMETPWDRLALDL